MKRAESSHHREIVMQCHQVQLNTSLFILIPKDDNNDSNVFTIFGFYCDQPGLRR